MTEPNLDTALIDYIEASQIEYFNWLCNQVEIGDHKGRSYFILAKLLHEKEFYAVLPLDENRIEDGKQMRRDWFTQVELVRGIFDKDEERLKYPLDSLDGPCSVFEMLVCFAKRIEEDIMDDSAHGDRTAVWFWEMIDNLGLSICSDDIIDLEMQDKINYVIHRVLDRSYSRDGKGGLWPLPGYSTKDQRKVELWYQMANYISNKYHS